MIQPYCLDRESQPSCRLKEGKHRRTYTRPMDVAMRMAPKVSSSDGIAKGKGLPSGRGFDETEDIAESMVLASWG